VDFLVKSIKRTLCDWKEKEKDVQEQIRLLAIKCRLPYPDYESLDKVEGSAEHLWPVCLHNAFEPHDVSSCSSPQSSTY
jgi:hypothetical protein